MLEPLSQYVRQADCSGGFVVLESSMSDWDAADARSGLYVQRANAGRVTNNLLLFRGIASVGKAHNVMPHRKWAQEFHIGQFPNYAEHTVQAAAPIADSRPHNRPCHPAGNLGKGGFADDPHDWGRWHGLRNVRFRHQPVLLFRAL